MKQKSSLYYSLAVLNAHEKKTELETSLTELKRHLEALEGYPVWVLGCRNEQEARDKSKEIYGVMHYMDEMKPEETSKVFGVVGGDDRLINLAKEVNHRKEEFAEAMAALRWEINPGDSKNQKKKALRKAVELLRDPRFHYRQAIRKIKILEETPQKMRFTWLRTHDLHRITREQAIEKLRKQLGDDHIQDSRDYRVLSSLYQGEILAEVTATPPDVHLHLHWKDRGVQAIQVNMPVIYPAKEGDVIPGFLELKPLKAMKPMRKMSNRKIENEPLIEGMNLYRYRSEQRRYH